MALRRGTTYARLRKRLYFQIRVLGARKLERKVVHSFIC